MKTEELIAAQEGSAYQVLESTDAVAMTGALPPGQALLLLQGGATLHFGAETLALTGGQGYLHAMFPGEEAAELGSAAELALPLTAEHCRAVLLRLPERLLPELPAGEVLQLEPAIVTLLQAAFFQPGRDERLRQAAAGYLAESLRYARPVTDGAPEPLLHISAGAEAAAIAPTSLHTEGLAHGAAKNHPGQDVPPGDPLAALACRLLQEEPERNWSLELLEERCGTERRKIAAAFRNCGLAGPLRYLNEVRIALASRLLAENEQTISQIAARTGYADVAGFSHFFRRHTGKSPRQYRQDTAWLI